MHRDRGAAHLHQVRLEADDVADQHRLLELDAIERHRHEEGQRAGQRYCTPGPDRARPSRCGSGSRRRRSSQELMSRGIITTRMAKYGSVDTSLVPAKSNTESETNRIPKNQTASVCNYFFFEIQFASDLGFRYSDLVAQLAPHDLHTLNHARQLLLGDKARRLQKPQSGVVHALRLDIL